MGKKDKEDSGAYRDQNLQVSREQLKKSQRETLENNPALRKRNTEDNNDPDPTEGEP